MPALTATQFYPYPVAADAPCDTPATLKAWVDQVDAALADMRVKVNRHLTPPMVILEYNPAVPVGLAGLDIPWNTVIMDDGGFFDPGVPTVITLPANGRYKVGMSAEWTDLATRIVLDLNTGYLWDQGAAVATGTNSSESRGGTVSALVEVGDLPVTFSPILSQVSGSAPLLKKARLWAYLVGDID